MAHVAHFFCEGGDDVGVADVLLLGGARHDEMRIHQPGNQFDFVRGQSVLFAESAGVNRAEFGVVAATPLGNVVEQGTQVEQFRPVKIRHELAGQRQFVRQCRHGKPSHITQHGEDVFVHGVDVEQVVLHLADDATEGRNVAAKQAVTMHGP